jgi:Domain of unknown function (DUF4352)
MNRYTIFSFISFAFLLCGCTGGESGTGLGMNLGPSKYPQSTELAYADPIKMKIERCYWSKTINPMEDYDQIYQPPANMPGMSKTAQDSYLVVELALTNYGNSPMAPTGPPLFELLSADGKTYEPVEGMTGMTQKTVMGGNINPGHALKGREIFDVPEGAYNLKVIVGVATWRIVPGGTAWIWQLSPTESK